MRNTIRKVTIVVPVLITSCQVSLKWKRGPVIAQVKTTANANAKAAGLPVARPVQFAKRLKEDDAQLVAATPFTCLQAAGLLYPSRCEFFPRLFQSPLSNGSNLGKQLDRTSTHTVEVSFHDV